MVVWRAGAHIHAILLANGEALGFERIGFHAGLSGLRCGLGVLGLALGGFGCRLGRLGAFLGVLSGLHGRIQRGDSLRDGRLLHGRWRVIRRPGALLDGDSHLVHRLAVGLPGVQKHPGIDRLPGQKIFVRDGHAVLVADLRLGVPAVLVVTEVHLVRGGKIFYPAKLQDLAVVVLPQRGGLGLFAAPGEICDGDINAHDFYLHLNVSESDTLLLYQDKLTVLPVFGAVCFAAGESAGHGITVHRPG